MTPPRIRWMIRRDLPACLAIEEQAFEFPWSEEDFWRVLQAKNCIGMVAEISVPVLWCSKTGLPSVVEEHVVGFMVYELASTELHVLNFVVDKRFRRKGIGAAMVEKLVSKLSYGRRDRIVLEVRETNLDAQLFFSRQGFKAVDVLRDYYDDTDEDAYAFQYDHRAPESEVERQLSDRKAVGQ